jgi:tetratricopeptide (TPR) repeat protein
MLTPLDLIKYKRYEEAHRTCLALIKKDVHNAHPYYVLGLIAFEHQNYKKALELFLKAVEYDPTHAAHFAHLAQTYSTLGQQNEAKNACDRAAHLPVKDAFIADTIGVVYSRTGYHEKAIPFFTQAIELNAAPANFHYNLGSSLQFSGQFDDAKFSYQNALARDPQFYRALSSLISLNTQTSEDNQLPALKSLFEHNKTDAKATLHLGHAIAKTLEDFGEYEQSYDWLGKAKKQIKRSISYSFPDDQKCFDAVTKTRASEDPTQTYATPPVNDAPIFIIGLPRTGTTLVDRIISTHADVTSAGELNNFAAIIKAMSATRSNLVMDAETLGAAHTLDLHQAGQRYIDSTKDLARGAGRFTDKMPLNFFYAQLIHKAMPHARIIALRRGAMDSCLSNYRQLFSTQHSYYTYTFDIETTAQYYRQFDTLMDHWRHHIPQDRFMEVRYEDIIDDQENQTRKLLEFCGLDWDPLCLRFHENTAPVSTASSVQVRQPLYRGSIDRWKRYGDKLDLLAETLGPLAAQ